MSVLCSCLLWTGLRERPLNMGTQAADGSSPNFVEDLDFADDLALISSSRSYSQTKVSNLGRYEKMTGLKINSDHDDMLEQHRRQKSPGRWKRTGNGVEICLYRNRVPGGGFRRRHQKQIW